MVEQSEYCCRWRTSFRYNRENVAVSAYRRNAHWNRHRIPTWGERWKSSDRCGYSVLKSHFVGALAKTHGALLRPELTLAGVNTDMLFQVDGPSGVSTILVNEKGDYRSIIISGVNRAITEQLCYVKIPSDASVLLVQNEIPETANRQCLAMAREAGVRTILNAAPFRSMDRSVLEVVDIIVMNCIEARVSWRSLGLK